MAAKPGIWARRRDERWQPCARVARWRAPATGSHGRADPPNSAAPRQLLHPGVPRDLRRRQRRLLHRRGHRAALRAPEPARGRPRSADAGWREGNTEAPRAAPSGLRAPRGRDPETPAAFLGAAADGPLVYFLDQAADLDATGGTGSTSTATTSGRHPHRAQPRHHRHHGARVEGMLGGRGDGRRRRLLRRRGGAERGASQAPAGETNLYAMDGTMRGYVARLGTGGTAKASTGCRALHRRRPNRGPRLPAHRRRADPAPHLLGGT